MSHCARVRKETSFDAAVVAGPAAEMLMGGDLHWEHLQSTISCCSRVAPTIADQYESVNLEGHPALGELQCDGHRAMQSGVESGVRDVLTSEAVS
jgi:hypothetical protein